MNHYFGGEKKFFDDINRFVKEVKKNHIISEGSEKDLEALIHSYEGNKGDTDPVQSLSQEDAKRLLHTQEKTAPNLADHPFFVRISFIACARFGKATQEIIDAHNFVLQEELGVSPVLQPDEEAILLVKASAKNHEEMQHAEVRMSSQREINRNRSNRKQQDTSSLHGKYLTETIAEILSRLRR